ncbi:MAG: hypothetical protein JSW08_02940 [archaeon]|nr:MAG: hypothetical protein JSW08_02940 [archaeon]
MNTAVKIILGIILVLIALFVAIAFGSWGHAVVEFLKGLVIVLVIVVGLILLVIGFSEASSK